MNTDPKHAGQVLIVGAEGGLLRRLVRWLNRPATVERHKQTRQLEPASWPECVGHPYVIGPGTLLVMTYMRARLPRYDRGELIIDIAMDLETNATTGLSRGNSLLVRRNRDSFITNGMTARISCHACDEGGAETHHRRN